MEHVKDIKYNYSHLPDYYTVETIDGSVKNGDATSSNIEITSCLDGVTGRQLWSQDGRGYVTRYEYDNLGRKTLIELPDDDDSVDWDPLTLSMSQWKRVGNPTQTITYDEDAHTIKVVDALDAIEDYQCDNLWRVTETKKRNRYGASEPVNGEVSYNTEETSSHKIGYDVYGNIKTVMGPSRKYYYLCI